MYIWCYKLHAEWLKRLTLASKMHRVVSICCMRRDMFASFYEKEVCDSSGYDICVIEVGQNSRRELKELKDKSKEYKPLHKLWKNG